MLVVDDSGSNIGIFIEGIIFFSQKFCHRHGEKEFVLFRHYATSKLLRNCTAINLKMCTNFLFYFA